ncbi:MAG: ParA family protein [Rhodospirillaceae bacterium]|nr:ParA family protein [Rhodospirillaceae bacterium]MBT3780527.1 ParA family protein [Rhodospirillaceae bacterium]MBT3977311.1 ParA family protein [Rhodospirillaceae bacterium]MBT4565735.1 ParA family protein [Rhodospirillaceae bacterium]MBT4743453.1 ParA family protein [Rhodospirillaceae bacterium]
MNRRVVTLATMKGGSGKSTIAVCLAAYWWKKGLSIALIDADPQRSVMRWKATGNALEGLNAEPADDQNVAAAISKSLDAGIERIVVDTPGFRAPVTETALDMAGLCLIPVRPSPVDFEVAADKVDLIADLKSTGSKGPLSYRFLMTQIIRGSVIARHMRQEMEAAGYPLLDAEIHHRVAYAETALMGSTPSLSQVRGAAAREIAALAAEVDSYME